MQKKNRRKLQLHRESIRGLDLGAVAGAASGNPDCTFVVGCTGSLATVCTGNVRCTAVDCSFVATGCTVACPA
jgi:hypothetical protein